MEQMGWASFAVFVLLILWIVVHKIAYDRHEAREAKINAIRKAEELVRAERRREAIETVNGAAFTERKLIDVTYSVYSAE